MQSLKCWVSVGALVVVASGFGAGCAIDDVAEPVSLASEALGCSYGGDPCTTDDGYTGTCSVAATTPTSAASAGASQAALFGWFCKKPPQTCGTYPTCGGACFGVGDTCQSNAAKSTCTCVHTYTCSDDLTCGGSCPSGTTCRSAGRGCSCKRGW